MTLYRSGGKQSYICTLMRVRSLPIQQAFVIDFPNYCLTKNYKTSHMALYRSDIKQLCLKLLVRVRSPPITILFQQQTI